MKKGIQISNFKKMMYNGGILHPVQYSFGQCSPACEPHLARRKVNIVGELFAKEEWINWEVISTFESHLLVICNSDGDSTSISAHMVKRLAGSETPWPIHKWKDPDPCVIKKPGKRFLYYPQTGEIWDSEKLVCNYEKLASSREEENKLIEMMKGTTLIVQENKFDPSKYLVTKTSNFQEMFEEQRSRLLARRREERKK